MHASSEIKEVVAFLYGDVFREKGDGFDRRPFGTCWFLRDVSPDGLTQTFTVITAKHVVQDLRAVDGEWYVRFNNIRPPEGPGGVEYVSIPKDGWIEHPDPAVDLITLPWVPPLRKAITFTALTLSTLGRIPPPLIEARLKRGDSEPFPWPPPEGEEVWLMGLLPQHHGAERNYPITRRGHVALMSDELIDGGYGLSEYYVIELQAFFGHSGAPVFALYEDYLIFLGVLASAFKAEEMTISTHDEPPTQHTYYNLGISLVTPYTKVLEVMELSKAKESRKSKQLTNPEGPVQLTASGVSKRFTRGDFEKALGKVSQRVKTSGPDSSSPETSE
jgi:hypothetical protein